MRTFLAERVTNCASFRELACISRILLTGKGTARTGSLGNLTRCRFKSGDGPGFSLSKIYSSVVYHDYQFKYLNLPFVVSMSHEVLKLQTEILLKIFVVIRVIIHAFYSAFLKKRFNVSTDLYHNFIFFLM